MLEAETVFVAQGLIYLSAENLLAYVKLSAMEASLCDVLPEVATLLVQTMVYFALAVAVYRAKLKKCW